MARSLQYLRMHRSWLPEPLHARPAVAAVLAFLLLSLIWDWQQSVQPWGLFQAAAAVPVLKRGQRLIPNPKKPFAVRLLPQRAPEASDGVATPHPCPSEVTDANVRNDNWRVVVAKPPKQHGQVAHADVWPSRTPGTAVMTVNGRPVGPVVEAAARAWNWAVNEIASSTEGEGSPPVDKVVFHAKVTPQRCQLKLTGRTEQGRFSATCDIPSTLAFDRWEAAAWLLASRLVAGTKPEGWQPPPSVLGRLEKHYRG